MTGTDTSDRSDRQTRRRHQSVTRQLTLPQCISDNRLYSTRYQSVPVASSTTQYTTQYTMQYHSVPLVPRSTTQYQSLPAYTPPQRLQRRSSVPRAALPGPRVPRVPARSQGTPIAEPAARYGAPRGRTVTYGVTQDAVPRASKFGGLDMIVSRLALCRLTVMQRSMSRNKCDACRPK